MKDVKVGDVVYIDVKIKTGPFADDASKLFTVPITVEKVTANQFVTADGRRYRKTPPMFGVGHNGRAYVKGADQRQQMADFREKVAAIDKAKDLAHNLRLDYLANYSKEDLQGLIQSLQKFSNND